jgi:pyruvate dehydrogenase E2 component (dihydrolipoamide acetyltransferase)
MHDVIMPKLGLTMESGTIEKWHKKEGDKIQKGDVLFEVMTDKVTIEVESYYSGYLLKIISGEGEEVPVKGVVAYIGEKNEELPEENVKIKESDIEKSDVKKADEYKNKITKKEEINKTPSKKRTKISPLAKKIASEKGIDIQNITGTGPQKRITKKDVLDYYEKIKKEEKNIPARESISVGEGNIKIKDTITIKGIRKTIAERMSYSKSNIPHIVLNSVANATELIKVRESIKEKIISRYGIKVTFTDFLIKICAISLRDNIEINSTLDGEKYTIYEDINIGVAVSSEEGLIVPTIFNCDKLGLLDISKKRIDLVERARNGKLKLEEIQNGTFTITNLGMFGIRSFSAIINPPQAAILAVGEVYDAPELVDGNLKKNSFINLTLSCDHRIIDGEMGSRFLKRIAELIENPWLLVL